MSPHDYIAENEALTGLVWTLGRRLGMRGAEIEAAIQSVVPDPFASDCGRVAEPEEPQRAVCSECGREDDPRRATCLDCGGQMQSVEQP